MIILLYALKVTLCSGILFGYYYLFLRNKRFHHYNRFYLLFSLVLSLILPLVKIPVAGHESNGVQQVIYQTAQLITVQPPDAPAAATNAAGSTLFTIAHATWLLYAAGVIFLLIAFIRSIQYIRGIATRYSFERVQNLRFYQTHEPGTPFSFFRSVFWNEQLPFNSVQGQQIFRHEVFHVQQKHSADVLLAELICMAGWFNPFFHLIKKELRTIHEFLADQYAASESDRYAYAELLVQQVMAARSNSIGHYFFNNHIKRRIAMITQLKNIRYGYLSRIMVLPISLVLFFSITLYAGTTQEKKKITAPKATPPKKILLLADTITVINSKGNIKDTITFYVDSLTIIDTAYTINNDAIGKPAVEIPAEIMRVEAPHIIVTDHVRLDTVSRTNKVYVKQEGRIQVEDVAISFNPIDDSTLISVSRFFNKSLRYPQEVLEQQTGGIVYFSFEVDQTGALKNYQYHPQAPVGVTIREVVVVGYAGSQKTNSKIEINTNTLLEKEVKRVAEKGATLKINSPVTGTYYYKATFRAQK